MVLKMGNNQKIDQGWEISGKDDILTVKGRQVFFIGNRIKKPWNDSSETRIRVKIVQGVQDKY